MCPWDFYCLGLLPELLYIICIPCIAGSTKLSDKFQSQFARDMHDCIKGTHGSALAGFAEKGQVDAADDDAVRVFAIALKYNCWIEYCQFMFGSSAASVGEAKIQAVDEASEKAIAAAEEVKAKQRALMEADLGEDALYSSPGKHRKIRYTFIAEACPRPDRNLGLHRGMVGLNRLHPWHLELSCTSSLLVSGICSWTWGHYTL